MFQSSNNINYIGKPFVKWVGGKRQLLSVIEETLPKEILTKKAITYVEPFVGGGAMLFWMLNNFSTIKKAIINDINSDLTNAYIIVRDRVNDLISLLKDIETTYLSIEKEEKRKEFYLLQRERYNTKSLDELENAALFIFLNRTCFNGLYRVNSSGLFNVPFGKYSKVTICDKETLLSDSFLLQKVEILTGDFNQTIKYAKKDSFFYIDPPYKPLSKTSSFNSYSKETFDDVEQIRLKHFCDNLNDRNSLWILSNSDPKSNDDNNNFFDDLYSAYQIKRILAFRQVNSNAQKRGKLNELLISNSI
ncbi:MAG: DNA adenine methylase [Bacteroidales bacterium]|jgi:DNA adenine methylase|nr:DNA adenine methylase [Bacteroidales bacterium]